MEKGTDNPITSVYFYTKDNDTDCFPSTTSKKTSLFLPETFQEEILRVYSKNDEKIEILKKETTECLRQVELYSVNDSATKQEHREILPAETALYQDCDTSNIFEVLYEREQVPPFNDDRTVLSEDNCQQILNDSIHGIITLHPLLFKIIDTPQFQRLRNIKQLGGCYFVYPGASHNRFEHSIGTCYLASKLANQLQSKLDEDINKLKKENKDYSRLQKAVMTAKDKLCIEIAALCHDLGVCNPNRFLQHEDVSRKMFDHMIQSNDSLKKEFDKIFKVKDLKFIKDLINGEVTEDDPQQKSSEVVEDDSQQYKKYMFEIVADKQNSIDVDKMDYFARDCHGLGMSSNFNHLRFISQCRIMFPFKDSNQTTIAVRDKEELNLYELFHTRNGLFRRAYQHPVTHGIQLIGEVKMSKAFDDMYAYEKLTDSVLDVILMSRNEGLNKSKDLIHRIYNRQLYKVVGIDRKEAKKIRRRLTKNDKQFGKDDFNLQTLRFSYGKDSRNPIKFVYFYKKDSDECLEGKDPDKTSLFLPSVNFQEEIILLYSTCIDDEKTNCIRRKWDEIQ
ncbi:SAMHD1 [Mytilus edulis]|uniref:SAMHD1 n=1 Tax=Mytilus edulis TaxID=6550 RepID=A0A8S3QB90_MYTED|nr:SAMHD1 [Mytilus edulis]